MPATTRDSNTGCYWGTTPDGRRTYTYDNGFGLTELRLGKPEEKFLKARLKDGYNEHDILMTMADDGTYGDMPMTLYNAWQTYVEIYYDRVN